MGSRTSKPVKTSTLKIPSRADKGASKYLGLIEVINSLKLGQSYVVPKAPGSSERGTFDRVNSAMRRLGARPPKGCRFRRRTLEGGDVAVSVVKK